MRASCEAVQRESSHWVVGFYSQGVISRLCVYDGNGGEMRCTLETCTFDIFPLKVSRQVVQT